MMMRPKQFYVASWALVLIALSFPLQVMVLYGHHWSEWGAVFNKFTFLNWLVIGSLLLGAYFYYQASRAIVLIAPVLLVLVAVNNYLVGQFAGDFSLLQTSLGTIGCGLLFAPLALPSSVLVLKDPRRRWWLRSKRLHKRVPATLNPFVGDMIQSHTFDVSQTGAFICLQDLQSVLPKVGDTVRVSFNVSTMKKIRCEAVVVRISEAKGHYPRGIGLRFTEIHKAHERSFENLLHSSETLQ